MRAKDLPTNGVYIARLLNGDDGLERFSWNGSASTHQDQPLLATKVDFKTLDEQARRDFGNRFPPVQVGSSILAVIEAERAVGGTSVG